MKLFKKLHYWREEHIPYEWWFEMLERMWVWRHSYKFMWWEGEIIWGVLETFLKYMERGWAKKLARNDVSSRSRGEQIYRDIHRTRLAVSRIYNSDYIICDSSLGKNKHFALYHEVILGPLLRSCRSSRKQQYEDYMEKQDIDYVCMMLKKHTGQWWD